MSHSFDRMEHLSSQLSTARAPSARGVRKRLARLLVLVGILAPWAAGAATPTTVWPLTEYRRVVSLPGGADSTPPLLANATRVDGDIGQARNVPLPFPFSFLGEGPFHSINVGAKGYLTFGTNPSVSAANAGAGSNLVDSAAPRRAIAAWWGNHVCPENGIRLKTLGSAPQRRFVIEWDGCSKRASSGYGSTRTTFQTQVWLFEGSGVIRVHYGTLTVDPTEVWSDLSWGLKPATGPGSLGPSAEGVLGSCNPGSAAGGKPACGLGDFPAETVIQYGLSAEVDLSGRVLPSSFSVTPSSFDLDVDLTLLNAGAAEAADVDLDLYFAAAPSLSPGETGTHLAASFAALQPIGAGESLVLPLQAEGQRPPNGSYRVCAFLDPTNALVEKDRTNNWVCSRSRVSLGPDLVGTILAPAVGGPGITVSIPISIHNQGTDRAGPFAYQIFAHPRNSENSVPTDRVFEGRVAGIEAGSTFSEYIPVKLSSILRGEEYAFELVLDPLEEVAEADRSNNRSVSLGRMLNLRPQLQITRPAGQIQLPEGCFYGERLRARVEICNSGRASAVGFRPGIIMGDQPQVSASFDPTAASSPQVCSDPAGPNYDPCKAVGGETPICAFDFCRLPCESDADCVAPARHCGDDPLLAEFLGVSSAKSCMNQLAGEGAPAANRCQTFELEGMIPTLDQMSDPLASGKQLFHLIDDVLHSTSQPYPDTIASAEFDCRPSLVDLVAASITPPQRMVPGKAAVITRLIRNAGYTNYAPGTFQKNEHESFSYRYYLSTVRDISSRQIELPVSSTGGAGFSSIGRKGVDLRTELVEVPPQLRPGEYYLGILLDPENELEELEEGNNLLVASTKVRIDPPALQILTASLPHTNVSAPFTHSLIATGSAWQQSWSAENLPPWLSLSPKGILSGAPTETGIFAFTVRVDAGDDHALRPLALQVLPGQGALTITSRSLPVAIRGSPYGGWYDEELQAYVDGVQLAASGGVPPYLWEADTEDEDSRLPEGIYGPTEDGWLRGQPTLRSETSKVRVLVRDSLGNLARAELKLVVVDAGSLVLSNKPLSLAISGQDYEDCIQARGTAGGFEWQVEESTLPPGLSAQPRGDRICLEGAPTACGNYEVEVLVVDGEGQSLAAEIPLAVECGVLQLDARSVRPVRRGEAVEFELGVKPSRAPIFRLHRGLLPKGLVLDPKGAIIGTVAEDADFGVHDVILELSDPEGRRNLSALSLRVLREAPAPLAASPGGGGCASAGTPAASLSFALLAAALWNGRRGPSYGRMPREEGSGAPPPMSRAPRTTKGYLLLFAVLLCACLLAACGGGDAELESRCAEVSCTSNMSCDEADGICKCGIEGESCTEDSVCVLDPSPHCVSVVCEFVSCERGERCNERSGSCECGGASCRDGAWCVNEACVLGATCRDVSCKEGTVCDPADLLCKCGGPGGLVCGKDKRCVQEPAPHCQDDRCAGVSCGSNSSCDPVDGSCHCGGAGGPVCSAGEACLLGDEGYTCALSDPCAGRDCQAGTICDPEDGQCRCGGIGASHPICTNEETCIEGSCRGGDLCAPEGIPTICAPGLSCDPNDGSCKCGGKGGSICGEGEGCTQLAGRATCTPLCTLLALASSCGGGEGCYFDPAQAHGAAFCAAAGEKILGNECQGPNDCRQGLYCNASMKCTQLCEIAVGPEFCRSVQTNLECVPFQPGDHFGYCRAP